MTREEAIAILEEEAEYLYQDDEPYNRGAFRMAIQALSQEPCDNTVSRKAVLNAIEHEDKWLLDAKGHNGLTEIAFSGLKARVDALPPVTQKLGKWIAVYQGDEIINYRCSECELGDTNGSTNLYGWDYCRRCGAKMVEPQESEVSNG